MVPIVGYHAVHCMLYKLSRHFHWGVARMVDPRIPNHLCKDANIRICLPQTFCPDLIFLRGQRLLTKKIEWTYSGIWGTNTINIYNNHNLTLGIVPDDEEQLLSLGKMECKFRWWVKFLETIIVYWWRTYYDCRL